MMAREVLLLCLLTLPCFVYTLSIVAPPDPDELPSTTQNPSDKTTPPDIKFLHYDTQIKNRYARTVVSSKVLNPANVSREIGFSLVLPDSAFISEFVMIIKDKEYKAYVKEKEEAKNIYNQAVSQGLSAAHVEQSARDSNQFKVSVNVEAGGKVTFKLTYEDLLARVRGLYNNIVHVSPGQIVKDLQVKIHIEEAVEITKLLVPNFRTKNEIVPEDEKENPIATIDKDPAKKNEATVTWNPSKKQQKEIAENGLKGQLVVQYDVDHSKSSEVLVDEGYFVHFFAPDSENTMAKHVVFVLDISGSMDGRKMEQLREAMLKILSDLNRHDYFSIVLFSGGVYVWSPHKTNVLFQNPPFGSVHTGDVEVLSILNNTKDEIAPATEANIQNAKEFAKKIHATDATNIMGAIRKGVDLISRGQKQFTTENNNPNTPQPLIIFLTDGYPNVEESNPNQIVKITTEINQLKTPIFSLSFGDGADLNFLRRLSLRNYGFARNIYEAGDAALQLNNFYKEISSPVMADVNFKYLPGQVDNKTLTKQDFPIVFRGSEIIVAGKLANDFQGKDFSAELHAGKLSNKTGYVFVIDDFILTNRTFVPQNNRTVGHMEKLWAYLRIKQLLDEDSAAEKTTDKNTTEAKDEALRLALKYSFVTPLTSLVVVKPNDSSTVDAEKNSPTPEISPLFLSGAPGAGQFGLSVNKIASFGRPSYASFGGGGYAGSFPAMAAGFPGPPPPMHSFMSMPLPSTPVQAPPADVTTASAETTTYHLPAQLVPLESVAWLNVTDDIDSTVVQLQKGNFTVKINETDNYYGQCVKPDGSPGNCRHLQYCALSVFTDNVEDYEPYFCDIDKKYAGVCCPFPLLPKTP